MSRNAAAVRFVQRKALGPDDERLLLDVLGLLDDMGLVRPDDNTSYRIARADVEVTPPSGKTYNGRPATSSAPDALRNLPPEAMTAAARPVGPPRGPKARPTQQPCGTETAAKRHRRNGDVDEAGNLTCAVCVAGRAARREGARKSAAQCGTTAGYERHRREGTPRCAPCLAANAAARRTHAARRRAAA